MRYYISFILLFGISLSLRGQSNSISGRVINEQSQPLAFVNIVLLNSTDSAFVAGAVSNDDGTFSIVTDKQTGLLKSSCIGYGTSYTEAHQGYVGDILMSPDSLMLNEVIVKGHRPAYKLTAEGIQTNVEGTILSKLGTGEDVLAHVPGIIKKRGGFEVFGKGTPLIYINGRLMRDASELDQLKSENIKSIELISTPGAMYDAAVKAVIKIRTKAIQGEGFGFDVRSSYNQRENTNLVEQLNWNYRHNRLDLFGTLYYALSNSNYSSTLNTLVQADTLWQQKYAEVFKPKSQSWHNTVGANYMFNDSNSIGFRYTLKFPLKAYHRGFANSDIIANGEYLDHIDNTVTDTINNRPDHQINMYYMGKIGRAEIEFNTDYLYNKDSSHALYDEQSASQESRLVTSENAKRNELFASKLTVGFPLFGGNLKIGTEYTHTKRNDNYINPEQYVPTSFAELKESHIASFATYSGHIACFQVMAGLRYEWVNFIYNENGKRLDEQSRSFGNLFPSISCATQLGKLQMQLVYTAKTLRPSYQQLSNNMSYGNRFLLQSGNPFLNHEYIHDLSLMGEWKFLNFSIGYNDRRDAIFYWAKQVEGNTAVTHLSQKNIPTLKSMSAQIAIAPNIGLWMPQLTASINKQWLLLHTDIADYKMNTPILRLSFNNTFDFGRGWVASADSYISFKGYSENVYYSRNVGTIDLSLTKQLLKDQLSIRIQGNDIFHTDKWGTIFYAGLMQKKQISWSDSQEFVLTLRYKFNTTRSKYKGTGAGNDEKNRL